MQTKTHLFRRTSCVCSLNCTSFVCLFAVTVAVDRNTKPSGHKAQNTHMRCEHTLNWLKIKMGFWFCAAIFGHRKWCPSYKPKWIDHQIMSYDFAIEKYEKKKIRNSRKTFVDNPISNWILIDIWLVNCVWMFDWMIFFFLMLYTSWKIAQIKY